jgi:MYXO-CTERM domain-containing protein
LLGLVGGCGLLGPALAFAQTPGTGGTGSSNTTTTTTGGISVQLKTVGDQAYTSQAFRRTPLGKTQCDKNVDLTFRLSLLAIGAAAPKYIEVYQGVSCYSSDAKDGIGDDCDRITYFNRNSSSIQDIMLPLKDFCTAEGDVTLWFLPVNTLNSTATIMPYGVFELPLDVIPPNAPTNVKGGNGETQIRVTWERADTNIARNYVIWDPKPITDTTPVDSGVAADGGDGAGAAGSGGSEDDGGTDTGSVDPSCVSPLLNPGAMIDIDNLPKGLHKKEAVGDVESFELSGDDINSPRAAVAVVARDLAGNVSVLSNVACVNVVDTSGFWDEYKVNGGDAEAGCACSLPGSPANGRHTAGGLLAMFAVLGLAVARVRRKRHS